MLFVQVSSLRTHYYVQQRQQKGLQWEEGLDNSHTSGSCPLGVFT